jgi:TPR repeat protein
MSWYKKADNQGHLRSIYNYGYGVAERYHGEADKREAMSWYK